MKKALIITKNELLQFFCNLSGYIFISVFVMLYAWFFSMPFFVDNVASLSRFFATVQLIFMEYIPIITMNMISKENQYGTIETLFTLPLKVSSIIVGKFLASFIIVLISLLPSVVHFITIFLLGENLDLGVMLCGYLSLILTSAVYCAIGVFTGTFSTNQIVSFIFSFLLIILFYSMDYVIAYLPIFLTPFLQYISITWQNSNLIKGVVDTRVLVYFVSLTFLFLFWATNVFERKSK